MNEYKKKLAVLAGQLNNDSPAKQETPMTNGIPNSALLSVFEGKTHATSEMMGHKQNLAPSIAAKMSQAFGMNLTGMQVYRSDAMVGTGMHGMAQGNKVVLSSDVDLNTSEGQAVLGHELSHINAQRQGIGTGHSGLYRNAALEHQADVEGMRAARGRPIYSSGMEYSDGMKYGLGMRGVEGLAPLSAGLGATAAAPMQADKAFTTEAAHKKLNEQLTEQLAAFGMKVVDEPVKPLKTRPQKSGKTGKQNTSGNAVKPPVENNQNHNLQPNQENVLGGNNELNALFENPPIFDQVQKQPNQENVLGGNNELNAWFPNQPNQENVNLDNQPVEEVVPQENKERSNGDIAKQLENSKVVKNADLRDFDPKFAKEVNKALEEAKKDFPDFQMNYVGTIQNQIEGLRKAMADEYEKALREETHNMYPDMAYKLSAKEHADLEMKKYESRGKNIEGWSIDYLKGPYAQFNGIGIHKKFASDNEFFNNKEQSNVDKRFSPEGCTTSKSTIDHEIGHQIDNMVNGNKDKYINDLYDQFMKEDKPEEKLSSYATTNIFEFIAEGYCEYRNNPTPREYATKIYNRLKELSGQGGKH